MVAEGVMLLGWKRKSRRKIREKVGDNRKRISEISGGSGCDQRDCCCRQVEAEFVYRAWGLGQRRKGQRRKGPKGHSCSCKSQ